MSKPGDHSATDQPPGDVGLNVLVDPTLKFVIEIVQHRIRTEDLMKLIRYDKECTS